MNVFMQIWPPRPLQRKRSERQRRRELKQRQKLLCQIKAIALWGVNKTYRVGDSMGANSSRI